MFCCRIGYSALEPTDTPTMAEYTYAHIDAGVKHGQRVSIVVTNIFPCGYASWGPFLSLRLLFYGETYF